jgi:hypothetical protein
MESMIEQWPNIWWTMDRAVGGLVMCCLMACLRQCWRQAQQNQKLALGDAFDYRDSERRGLLLPVSADRRY